MRCRTVAITPTRSTAFDFKDVVRVCQTSTLAGLRAMYESGVAKPFRFLYVSGFGAERDRSRTPSFKPEYSWMRVRVPAPRSTTLLTVMSQGETENQVLVFAAEHPGEVEASAAKPGLITTPGRPITSIFARAASAVGFVPCIDRAAMVTAMLDQVTNGFESDTLMNDDLVRLAKGLTD